MGSNETAVRLANRIDQDAIHSLHATVLPIKSSHLKNAKLIKNVHLNTVVELESTETGAIESVPFDEISAHLHTDEEADSDIAVLSEFSILPSFDCYTLGSDLARLNVTILKNLNFQLSNAKIRELSSFMGRVTVPLVKFLYGDESGKVKHSQSLAELVKDSDDEKVRNKLEGLASGLRVSLSKLPTYIEKFGEFYLSLAFFEGLFIENRPKLEQMLMWIDDAAEHPHTRNNPESQKAFSIAKGRVQYLKENLEQRFKYLNSITQVKWDRPNFTEFEEMQKAIGSQHIYLASGLCAVAVKVSEWERQFPNAGGVAEQCLEFVLVDLIPGLDNLALMLPEFEPKI